MMTRFMHAYRANPARSLSQALASLTSLRVAGQASIAAALRCHAAARIARCERHEVLNGSGRRPALPCRAPAVTGG